METSAFEVQRAGVLDVDLLTGLFDQYRQFYGQASDLIGAREFLTARLKSHQSIVFYSVKQADPREDNQDVIGRETPIEIAGFTQLYPSFSSVSMRPLWILNDLFVAAPFRRQRVAEKLIQAAVDFASETRACGLTLKTASDNKQAQALYEKLGWLRDEKFLTYSFRVSEPNRS